MCPDHRKISIRWEKSILSLWEELAFLLSSSLSSQAGWKESHAIFMTELRNLQAVGLTTFGQSLRTAFDLLNLNRLVSGIDNYGQVRYLTRGISGDAHDPLLLSVNLLSFQEPCVLIWDTASRTWSVSDWFLLYSRLSLWNTFCKLH